MNSKKLSKCLLSLGTSLISDSLVELGFESKILSKDIVPIDPQMACAGPLFTIKGKSNVTKKEKLDGFKLMESIYTGCVIIIDTINSCGIAHWGELMSISAIYRGANGVIVNGGCRDIQKIIDMKFPTFCRYSTPREAMDLYSMGECQISINMPSIQEEPMLVHPMDYVIADRDGILIIPIELINTVLKKAEEIKCREEKAIKVLKLGASVEETFKKFNIG